MNRILSCFSLGMAGLACLNAIAADAPDDKWHGSISLGGSAAAGNSSSTVLSAAADADKASSIDKISLYGKANYGSSKTSGARTTTADSLRLGGRYDYNLSERVFSFGTAESETDKIAGLRSRYALGGGLGYKVLRSDAVDFDVFAGLGGSRVEYTDGSSTNGAELTLGEESSHRIGESSRFKQRLVVRPGGNDLGTLTTFDASLSTSIVGAWTLDTGLSVRNASVVPADRKSTDTLLTVGFGYKY